MLPIRDHNPSGRTPYVTFALMAANILIFLSYGMAEISTVNAVYYEWAMIPARISFGEGYYTFVTSMFLHGGWMHLAGNMLFLWIFGDNIEDEMGHIPYLIFYLATGILAGLVQYLTATQSGVPTVGASGAIAGVMGGYLLLYPKAKIDILLILIVFFRIFPIPAWIMLMAWFAMQFFGGWGADPDTGGVAYWAHAGGFVAGIILAVPIWLKRGATRFWQANDFHPPHPEAKYDLSRIPKVSR
ncbi:MAG: membrane associated rhomboid family serine protease [Ascidiaceihabitans sp.]|jgi:membrane associated rhomboid family serine protease